MDIYNVHITEPAENDLREIVIYISTQLKAETTALNMVRSIKTGIEKLETNAPIYPLVRDERLAAMGYRMLVIKNYTAFYIIDEKNKTVDIDRILYGRRDWQNIL